jgi:hypothetical protein
MPGYRDYTPIPQYQPPWVSLKARKTNNPNAEELRWRDLHQRLMKFVKHKLKIFTGSKEPGDKVTAITCYVFGGIARAAAVLLFVVLMAKV